MGDDKRAVDDLCSSKPLFTDKLKMVVFDPVRPVDLISVDDGAKQSPSVPVSLSESRFMVVEWSLVGDGKGERNRVDTHHSDGRGSRNRVNIHCIAQERSKSWGGWICLIDRHRGLRFANVATAKGRLENILALG